MGYIYKISNLKNGLVYIGQTTRSIEERFKEHIYTARAGAEDKFHKAMRQIGIENFFIEPIGYYDDNNWLDIEESNYIAYYNSYHKGYNSNGGPCGDLKESQLDNTLWHKVITTLCLSGQYNEKELKRINDIFSKGCISPYN